MYKLIYLLLNKGGIIMDLKNIVAESIAKLAMVAAKEASGTASWYGSGQPKEPESLKTYFSEKGHNKDK